MFAATTIASPSAARHSSEPSLTLRTPSSPNWATEGRHVVDPDRAIPSPPAVDTVRLRTPRPLRRGRQVPLEVERVDLRLSGNPPGGRVIVQDVEAVLPGSPLAATPATGVRLPS